MYSRNKRCKVDLAQILTFLSKVPQISGKFYVLKGVPKNFFRLRRKNFGGGGGANFWLGGGLISGIKRGIPPPVCMYVSFLHEATLRFSTGCSEEIATLVLSLIAPLYH